MKEELIEKIAKALSDKSRVAILREIARCETISCKEAEECTNLSQPTISHHVKILVDAGLVISEKDGRHTKLKVNKKELSKFTGFFDKLG